jgi:hypothetical protein
LFVLLVALREASPEIRETAREVLVSGVLIAGVVTCGINWQLTTLHFIHIFFLLKQFDCGIASGTFGRSKRRAAASDRVPETPETSPETAAPGVTAATGKSRPAKCVPDISGWPISRSSTSAPAPAPAYSSYSRSQSFKNVARVAQPLRCLIALADECFQRWRNQKACSWQESVCTNAAQEWQKRLKPIRPLL